MTSAKPALRTMKPGSCTDTPADSSSVVSGPEVPAGLSPVGFVSVSIAVAVDVAVTMEVMLPTGGLMVMFWAMMPVRSRVRKTKYLAKKAAILMIVDWLC